MDMWLKGIGAHKTRVILWTENFKRKICNGDVCMHLYSKNMNERR